VPPTKTSNAEPERVDRVVVVVITLLLMFVVIRGVIPALMHGSQVGMAMRATGLALFAPALSLLPAWRGRCRRSERRSLSSPS